MKKLIPILGAAALTLLTTSCLQQETTLSLNKDGSGTITETTTFGAQMLAMIGAAGGEAGDPLAQMIAQAKAKAEKSAPNMGDGVSLKDIKPLNEGGKKGMVVTYAFKDINKLKYAFGQSLGGGPEEDKEKEPLDISYKDGLLTINNKYEKPKEDAEAPKEAIDESGLMMAKQMMGDMRISLKLEFPGGIAETNAEHTEANKVTIMDVDFGKLIAQEDKFQEFMKGQPGSPAAAKEMLRGVDGVVIETAEKLTVKLK